MEIQIKLEKEDWKKYQSYLEKELPKHSKSWMNSFWVQMLIWMILAFIFMVIFQNFSAFHWPTAASVAIFFILFAALWVFNIIKIRKAFEPSETGLLCGIHTFKFTEHGIDSEGKGYTGYHGWEIVKKVERAKGMIIVYVDTAYAYVFPESKLDNPDNFYAYILDQYSKFTN